MFSFGGSYPGFLSAMLRLRYPAVIDGAYAASAPVRIYAQQVQQYAYYQVVTRSAERAVSGCSAGVAKALKLVAAADSDTLLKELRLCTPLPGYMSRGGGTLREELLMVFRIAFANLNMANYPPAPSTGLAAWGSSPSSQMKSCATSAIPTSRRTTFFVANGPRGTRPKNVWHGTE